VAGVELAHTWHWTGFGGALGSQLTPLSPRLLAWQAWHLATWTVRFARRAWHLATSTLYFAWQAWLDWLWWRAWFPVDAVVAAPLCVAGVAAALCVAGVALADIDLHFARQAWHLATWTCNLRGRCGTYGTGLALVSTCHEVRQQQHSEPAASSLQAQTVMIVCGDITATSVLAA